MYTLDAADTAALQELNSTYRTKVRKGKDYPPDGVWVGEVLCLVTNKVYASAQGTDEIDALHNAIEIAKTATKPYATREAAVIEGKDQEIARLQRELEEVKAATPGTGVVPAALDEKSQREEAKKLLDAANIKYSPKARLSTLQSLIEEHKLSEVPA